MAIPKINHQLWISRDNLSLPKDIKKNINSWKKTHPDFKHILWSLDELSKSLADFYTLPINHYIGQCRFPAMKSDLIRLALIYKYGGAWNDLKNIPFKPLIDKFIDEKAVIFTEHWPTKTVNKKLPHISNSFLAAPPEDPLIWRCIELVCHNIDERLERSVYDVTGGSVISDAIRENNKKDQPLPYTVIPHAQIWNNYIGRSGGSYDQNGNHWSVRQKNESLYN